MLRLLLIVIAFIVYGSLYPFHFDFDRTDASPLLILLHAWPAKIDRFAWRDAGVNVLLYFPAGGDRGSGADAPPAARRGGASRP